MQVVSTQVSCFHEPSSCRRQTVPSVVHSQGTKVKLIRLGVGWHFPCKRHLQNGSGGLGRSIPPHVLMAWRLCSWEGVSWDVYVALSHRKPCPLPGQRRCLKVSCLTVSWFLYLKLENQCMMQNRSRPTWPVSPSQPDTHVSEQQICGCL